MPSGTFHPGPTVVFVDNAQWESFFLLAVILRKAGIRTVRISVGSSRWHVDQILFDRHISLLVPPTPEELAEMLSSEYVTDIQPTESMAKIAYAAVNLLPSSQRSDFWIGRSEFIDKWDVAITLRNLGIPTPDALLAECASPIEAVAQLSLPIVLKRRVGAAGSGVEIFNTLESLEEFVSEIDNLSEWFFERFINGKLLVCAVCVGNEGIDVMATYEILKRRKLHGSSVVVEIRHDARVSETGRVLISAINIRGLICFDVIRDFTGVDWVHDVNPRAFGSFITFQQAGYDFSNAYVQYLTGGGLVQESRDNAARQKALVFPYGLMEVFRSREHGIPWFRTLESALRYWRLLGPRYFFSLAVRGIAYSFRMNRTHLGFRRH